MDKARKHLERGFHLAWVEQNANAALEEFRAGLELQPDMAEIHLQIGQVHFHSDTPQYEEALREFLEVTRLLPKWAEGHLWAANTLDQLDRLHEALNEFRVAAELAPDDPRIHISMGRCLSKMSRFSEAIASFKEGIRLKPVYGEMDARMLLAEALRDNGQLPEAVKELRTVAAMQPVWSYEMSLPDEARQMIDKYEGTR
jgi:tetratricopeptide (TPR) repeat protein